MEFRAVIEQSGKTATGIHVPDEVVSGLNSGKKPAVHVSINGYKYRSTVGSMGGRFMIPLSAEHRTGAGVAAGEEVQVELTLDTEVRELAIPEDLQAALEQNEAAKRFFESISYSNKRRIVMPIEAAKAAETRAKRIEKSVALLQEGRIQ
jgi:hypothetical protein